MHSNNPVLSRASGFNGRPGGYDTPAPSAAQLEDMYAAPPAGPLLTGRMTYDDVVVKTGIMFAVLLGTAVISWQTQGRFALIGAIVGLVLGLVNAFKKNPSPPLMLAYAAFQGLFVGGISFMFENMVVSTNADGTSVTMSGIVAQAVIGTLGVFAVALWAYRSKRIRVTPKFQRGVMIALGGYLIFVVFNLIAQLTGLADGTFGFRSGFLGIAIGLFAIALAAFVLILDFDFIENGVKSGMPAKFAWTAAFGLTVTLVWLYVEILRLLAILRGGD